MKPGRKPVKASRKRPSSGIMQKLRTWARRIRKPNGEEEIHEKKKPSRFGGRVTRKPEEA